MTKAKRKIERPEFTEGELRILRPVQRRRAFVYVEISGSRRIYRLDNGRRVSKLALESLVTRGKLRTIGPDLRGEPMQWGG